MEIRYNKVLLTEVVTHIFKIKSRSFPGHYFGLFYIGKMSETCRYSSYIINHGITDLRINCVKNEGYKIEQINLKVELKF